MTAAATDLAARLRLYVIPDREIGRGRSLIEQTRAALEGGATVIQLRDKDAPRDELLAVGRQMKALCAGHGALFIVNDHVDLAVELGADGVHVGQGDLAAAHARAALVPGMILGVSAATVSEARSAVDAGADYLGVGAIWPTSSKADARATGLEGLRAIAASVTIPIVAIGGISLERAPQVLDVGASGIAVISAVVAADDIAEAARRFRRALE